MQKSKWEKKKKGSKGGEGDYSIEHPLKYQIKTFRLLKIYQNIKALSHIFGVFLTLTPRSIHLYGELRYYIYFKSDINKLKLYRLHIKAENLNIANGNALNNDKSNKKSKF